MLLKINMLFFWRWRNVNYIHQSHTLNINHIYSFTRTEAPYINDLTLIEYRLIFMEFNDLSTRLEYGIMNQATTQM